MKPRLFYLTANTTTTATSKLISTLSDMPPITQDELSAELTRQENLVSVNEAATQGLTIVIGQNSRVCKVRLVHLRGRRACRGSCAVGSRS